MIAVAGNGDIYLSTQNDGTAVLAFDAEGNFLNKISYDYKVYTLRTAMGRGRDGKERYTPYFGTVLQMMALP